MRTIFRKCLRFLFSRLGALQQLSSFEAGCFWGLQWVVGYILSNKTEATALLLMVEPDEGGGTSSDASVKPGPNEAGPSNASPANAGSPEGDGRTEGGKGISSLDIKEREDEPAQQQPAEPTVKSSNQEPPILQAPPTIEASPVREQPQQPERSPAEEVALAGAKGMASEFGKCLCQGGLEIMTTCANCLGGSVESS